jgi:hypothetical protein
MGRSCVLFALCSISHMMRENLELYMHSDRYLIGEFRLARFRRVLGVKLREVLMPKLHGKTLVSKVETSW